MLDLSDQKRLHRISIFLHIWFNVHLIFAMQLRIGHAGHAEAYSLQDVSNKYDNRSCSVYWRLPCRGLIDIAFCRLCLWRRQRHTACFSLSVSLSPTQASLSPALFVCMCLRLCRYDLLLLVHIVVLNSTTCHYHLKVYRTFACLMSDLPCYGNDNDDDHHHNKSTTMTTIWQWVKQMNNNNNNS